MYTLILDLHSPVRWIVFASAALVYTLATLVITVAIPWWRPVFPGLA